MTIVTSLSANFGSSPNVNATIAFGSSAFGVPLSPSGGSWVWTGLVPSFVPAGAAFTINATAHAQIGTFITVDGQTTITTILENVLPAITVDPFQSPVVVAQLPYVFQLSGHVTEGLGPPYAIAKVEYQVGTAPLVLASLTAAGIWQGPAQVTSIGDSLITIKATDIFGGVSTTQRTVSLLQYQMPAVIDPNAKKTLAGVPTTSSVTSWTRLEPQVANADIGASSNA